MWKVYEKLKETSKCPSWRLGFYTLYIIQNESLIERYGQHTSLKNAKLWYPFYSQNFSILKWLSKFEHRNSKSGLWSKYSLVLQAKH